MNGGDEALKPLPLSERTDYVCSQLTRYGDGIQSPELADALDEIVEINDDIAHSRDPTLIREGIERAKRLLDAVLTIH